MPIAPRHVQAKHVKPHKKKGKPKNKKKTVKLPEQDSTIKLYETTDITQATKLSYEEWGELRHQMF